MAAYPAGLRTSECRCEVVRSLGSDVEVHVRRVGRDGNSGSEGGLGASVLLTSTDPDALAHDVDVLRRAPWFGSATPSRG